MEGTKISFGFKKVKKAEKPVIEEQKDYIECLEEKSIKIVGGEKVEEKAPLVIPMKPNTLITAEKLQEIAAKVESAIEAPVEVKQEPESIVPSENETLEQMAVRELLQEAKKDVKIDTQSLTVPVPSQPVLDGQKESTLEDYEAVPIQDFGMAMLRGMGWTPEQEKANKYKLPELRPKGLGLGADKVVSEKHKKKATSKDGKGEELSIVKDSFVKIVVGKHSGCYGKVVSLDEENGRVMVDIPVHKTTVSLSEFMMQPITKAEFDKESKVINMGAYEEYKKKENTKNQNSSRNSPQVSNSNSRNQSPKYNDRDAKSSKNSDSRKDSRTRDEIISARERKQERNRRNSSSDSERARNEDRSRRDSKSEEKVRTNKERTRRHSSEENSRKVEHRRNYSSSPDNNRKKKEFQRRRQESSSESDDRNTRRRKEKPRRDSSGDDRRRIKKEKDKKRYSSNESLSSISDSERKKKHKKYRKRKDSSDSESDVPKKDKRDIDKKRKGKKKKRDRDRSPNYKKHRK